MYCLLTAKTVDFQGSLPKSYKNNRTKKSRYPFGCLEFFVAEGTRKGDPAFGWVKIESWRAIFSPWGAKRALPVADIAS